MSRNVSLADEPPAEEIEDTVSSEFPGGGPRVVGVRDTSDVVSVNQSLRESYAASKMTRGAPRRQSDSEAFKLNERVPMLMDSVEDVAKQGASHQDREPVIGSLDHLDDEYDIDSGSDGACDDDEIDALAVTERATPSPTSSSSQPTTDKWASHAKSEKSDSVLQQNLPFDGDAPRLKKSVEMESAKAESPKPAAHSFPDEVLVINIMARRGEQFAGSALLDALLGQGLRFGDMDIFHRHETSDGHGKVLFSVANMLMPGTFALEAMDDFESPGISMFLSLPIDGDSLSAFNLMAESAQTIAKALGGELKDENRSVMTRQTFEHGRQRVLEYERKRRLAKA